MGPPNSLRGANPARGPRKRARVRNGRGSTGDDSATGFTAAVTNPTSPLGGDGLESFLLQSPSCPSGKGLPLPLRPQDRPKTATSGQRGASPGGPREANILQAPKVNQCYWPPRLVVSDGPLRPQDGSKVAQEGPGRGPREAQEDTKSAPEHPKRAPRGLFEGSDGGTSKITRNLFLSMASKIAPGSAQEASNRPAIYPQKAPICSPEASKTLQEAPGAAKRAPRRLQDVPKNTSQETPRGIQEASGPFACPPFLVRLPLLLLPPPFPHLLLRFLLHPPLLEYGGIPRPLFLCMLPHFPDRSNSSGHRCCWKDDRLIPIVGTLR